MRSSPRARAPTTSTAAPASTISRTPAGGTTSRRTARSFGRRPTRWAPTRRLPGHLEFVLGRLVLLVAGGVGREDAERVPARLHVHLVRRLAARVALVVELAFEGRPRVVGLELVGDPARVGALGRVLLDLRVRRRRGRRQVRG